MGAILYDELSASTKSGPSAQHTNPHSAAATADLPLHPITPTVPNNTQHSATHHDTTTNHNAADNIPTKPTNSTHTSI